MVVAPRTTAQDLAARLPDIRLRAEHLAKTLILGIHGRRRSGVGGDFWQYRKAETGDSRAAIDWRRSARSDISFVRETESTFSRDAIFAFDLGNSMDFSSTQIDTKLERQLILGLALAISLLNSGERVGLAGGFAPQSGRHVIEKMMEHISAELAHGSRQSHTIGPVKRGTNCIVISDFLGPIETLQKSVSHAAAAGANGVLLQILDPAEKEFGFQGRTIFEGSSGGQRYETMDAANLQQKYLGKLAARQDEVNETARKANWAFLTHVTTTPSKTALLKLVDTIGVFQ